VKYHRILRNITKVIYNYFFRISQYLYNISTMQYKQIHVGDLTEASLRKAAKSGTLSIPATKMNGGRLMLVHPLNYEKYQKAKKSGRGTRLSIAPGEVNADLMYHANTGAGMHGGSLWSWIKDKAFPWVKNTLFPALKPVLGPLVDQGAQMLGSYTGQPAIVGAVRGLVKSELGVGLKGSQSAKDKMARVRAGKRGGAMKAGSFKL
jgi:hypothetical protein